MTGIEKFVEVRRDGKLIVEGMSLRQIGRLGPTESIVELTWEHHGKKISLPNKNGIWGIVVEGRNYVALTPADDDSKATRTLHIVSASGEIRHSLKSDQILAAKGNDGVFGWFERHKPPIDDRFYVILQFHRNGADYRLDVDAKTGDILEAKYTR